MIVLGILGVVVALVVGARLAGLRLSLSVRRRPEKPTGEAGHYLYGSDESAVAIVRPCAWCGQIDAHAEDCQIRGPS